MRNGALLVGWLLVATGCYSLSERPGGPLPVFTYQEVMAAARTKYVPPEEELAQCPRFNGVFEINNSAQSKGSYHLTYFLLAVGLKHPATNYPGGRPEDPPVPISARVEALFSHTQEGLTNPPYVTFYDLTTIELRPLGNGRFRARIAHRDGRVAEGTVELWLYRANSGDGFICERGAVKSMDFFKRTGLQFGWRLYEEPETGDILMVDATPEHAGTITSRFKRVGR
jgi:hypothetical protein